MHGVVEILCFNAILWYLEILLPQVMVNFSLCRKNCGFPQLSWKRNRASCVHGKVLYAILRLLPCINVYVYDITFQCNGYGVYVVLIRDLFQLIVFQVIPLGTAGLWWYVLALRAAIESLAERHERLCRQRG